MKTQSIFALFAVSMLSHCSSSTSTPNVRYTNYDANHRVSTAEDTAAVFRMRNTIFFLNSTTAMTANHTGTYSAHPWNAEGDVYLVQGEILEHSAEDDYKIFEVKWFKQKDPNNSRAGSDQIPCPTGTKFLNKISELAPEADGAENLTTEKLSVVGFPRDLEDAITSFGSKFFFASEKKIKTIYFNASAVSGNSGSPILDSKGHLLGMVLGGPSYELEPKYEAEDIASFNYGLSAKSLYENSPVFKKIIDESSTSDGFCK